MKNICTLLFLGIAFLVNAQTAKLHFHHNHSQNPEIACPIGEPMPGFVVPARAISRNNPNPATFVVTYDTNVPTAARNAFERATDIMSNLISSPIPITVVVNTVDTVSNTLAAASAGQQVRNFKNAPIANTNYPIALAEKLAEEELNNSITPYDIFVTYNTTQNWNYTSTSVTAGQFDFVTVILHELIHGLGIASSAFFNNDSRLGFVHPFTDNPNAYTNAIETMAGQNLVAEFEEGSAALGTQLRSNSLFIRTASFAKDAVIPKIYAPSSYSGGSSISHLDEMTFRNTPNALMKPSIAPGAVIHDPGDIALNILYDIGWSFTNVVHESENGVEGVDTPYEVVAKVISEQGYDPNTMLLHYSTDDFQTETTVEMTPTGNPDEFTATLPAPNEFLTYQYYIAVQNSQDLTFTSPANAPVPTFHTYFYQLDETLPEMVHEPTTKIGDQDKEMVLDASVTDFFTGVKEVKIEYKVNGISNTPVLMEKDSTDEFRPDLYKGVVNLPRILRAGNILEYRIVATDNSIAGNTITVPADGSFFEVEVTQIKDAVPFYVNDFESNLRDFDGNGFSVTNPNGFSDNAIHSTHPYPNAGTENTLNFVYNLSFPIVVRNTDALIEFDEIVLVEPGEPNTTYTELEFWDYVIVEGRKLEDAEWKPFLNGYDSRANPDWLNAYSSGLQGQNSSTTGEEDLYRARTIDIQRSGDFVEGDTILVRFRLFSDPFAFGWGWAIDNLRIQDTEVAVEDFIAEQDFTIYPNPIGDQPLIIEAKFQQPITEINLQLSNIHGQQVLQQNYQHKRTHFIESLDVATLPKGVYLLTLIMDNQEQISRRIVKQ